MIFIFAGGAGFAAVAAGAEAELIAGLGAFVVPDVPNVFGPMLDLAAAGDGGELPAAVVACIESAEVPELDTLAERFVTAARLEDVVGSTAG